MKKLFTFVALVCVSISLSADIRVLSDTRLGDGFFPRFTDAETVVYLSHGRADYFVPAEDAALRVDNENLDLNLYRNGEKVVLKPHGDVNYICASLSPSQDRILFRSVKGTSAIPAHPLAQGLVSLRVPDICHTVRLYGASGAEHALTLLFHASIASCLL